MLMGPGSLPLSWWFVRVVGAALVLVLVSLVCVPVAFGATGYGLVGSFGGPGGGDGLFVAPKRTAVDAATGNVFVADRDNNRVQVFAGSGSSAVFVGQISTLSDASTLSAPFGIAIDQSASPLAVYVSDAGNSRIVKLVSDGAPVPSFTVDGSFVSPVLGSGAGEVGRFDASLAVDPVSHDLLVADPSDNRVKRFTQAGVFVSSFDGTDTPGEDPSPDGAFVGLQDVAVSAAGKVLVVDGSVPVFGAPVTRAERFSAGGGFEAALTRVGDGGSRPVLVAVNPVAGSVVVLGRTSGPNSASDLAVYQGQTLVGTVVVPATGQSDPGKGYLTGLAIDGGVSGRLYLATDTVFGVLGQTAVQVYDPIVLPDLIVDPVVGPGSESVGLSGSVNPNGSATSARFEWSSDGGVSWNPLPAHDSTTDPGLGGSVVPVPVTDALTGLVPDSAYQVRLVATNAGGEAISAVEAFRTAAAPPDVTTSAAGDRSDTAATLGGTVDPNSSPTTWWVEYGTTTDYGQSFPEAKDAYAGTGNGPTVLAKRVAGLEPDTTYHFRIVANNRVGTTNGPDRTFKTLPTPVPVGGGCGNETFRTGPSAALGDCRAYEKVSPQDKNGIDVAFDGKVKASTDGNTVAYQSYGGFAGGGSGPVRSQYLATRHQNQWDTLNINPPYEPDIPANSGSSPPEGGDYNFTENLAKGTAKVAQSDKTLGGTGINTLLYDTHANTFTPITRPWTQGITSTEASLFVGGSGDFGHIAIESAAALTEDAPESLDNNHTGESAAFLFEWTVGGLRLASVLPDGTAAPGGASLGNGIRNNPAPADPGDHAISLDGSRIYFSTNPGASSSSTKTLYLREDPDLDGPQPLATVKVDTPERVAPDAEDANSYFQAASADGRYAFFTSGEKLTEDATAGENEGKADLYRFDAQAPEGSRLTDLTTTDPQGGGTGGNPRSPDNGGVVGASEDGTRVYFVATGNLAPGATSDALNLYLWQQGQPTRHITTLQPDDLQMWSMGLSQRTFGAGWTPDGGRLLFRSSARVTAYDNDGHYQLYLYDAADDEVLCVSCNPRASSSTANASLKRNANANAVPTWRLRNLTEDGNKVFFDTPEALLSEDTNGQIDVYQWAGGQLSLISTGKSDADSAFIDATPNGDNVFFTTLQALLPSDTDTLVDLYDARTGGGQPLPVPDPVCHNESCPDPPKPPPTFLPPATPPADDPGNPNEPNPTLTVRITRAQRTKLAQGHTATITIKTTTPGTIRVTAKAKLAGKTKTIARATKPAAKPGTHRLRIHLTKPARAKVAHTHHLKTTITTTLPNAPTHTLNLNLNLKNKTQH